MPWASRSADARDHCSISRLSPRLCLDLSRVDDVARQVNAPVVDERQDGARNDAPGRAHAEWNERLQGHHLRGLISRPEGRIVEKLQIGEIGERILRLPHEGPRILGERGRP